MELQRLLTNTLKFFVHLVIVQNVPEAVSRIQNVENGLVVEWDGAPSMLALCVDDVVYKATSLVAESAASGHMWWRFGLCLTNQFVGTLP